MKILLVIMLLAGCGDALAQDTKNPRAYDAQRKYQGYTVQRPGEVRAYSNTGKFEGRGVERPDGSVRVYDKDGKLKSVIQKTK